MALGCPRCAVEMTVLIARSSHARHEVDRCPRCAGLWLDAPELMPLCPTAAHLSEHKTEVMLTGTPGGGIARCPRCAAVPYQLLLADVPIDFCVKCAGVWLDGDEYHELEVEVAEHADDTAGPYRRSAARVMRTGKATCAYCGEEAAPKQMFVQEHGFACRPCFARRSQAVADRRATEEQTLLDALADTLFVGVAHASNEKGPLDGTPD